MAGVYGNSFLTIAATRAVNPDESCFSRRPGPATTVHSVHVRHSRRFPNTQSAETTQSFPLLCRGWAYQERILAPRVLHFGPDEVVRECRENRQCESGRNKYYLHEVDKGTFFRCITAPPSADNQRQVRNLWCHIVVQYTAFDLTKSSDVLPALSGLAELMSRSRQGEDYLAGLWSGSLITDLLWYRYRESYRHGPKAIPGPAEETWRAPTWSWASVYGGRVLYPQALYRNRQDLVSSYCQVVKAECTPAGASKTGQITSGHIKLQCPILKMPTDGVNSFHFWVDNGYANSIGDNVYVCRIAKVGRYEYWLVLEAVNLEDQEFRRIGLAGHSLAWPRETTVITVH